MKRTSLVSLIIIAGGAGLVGCGSTDPKAKLTDPKAKLDGLWAEPGKTPPAGWTLSLSESGSGQVTGTARSLFPSTLGFDDRNYTVAGSNNHPAMSLLLRKSPTDPDTVRLVGQLTHPDTMAGTFTQWVVLATCGPSGCTFSNQSFASAFKFVRQ